MGVTRPEITVARAKAVAAFNGDFYRPEFQIEIDVHIWYQENAKFAKGHEWRHAMDIFYDFEDQIDYLSVLPLLELDNGLQFTVNRDISS